MTKEREAELRKSMEKVRNAHPAAVSILDELFTALDQCRLEFTNVQGLVNHLDEVKTTLQIRLRNREKQRDAFFDALKKIQIIEIADKLSHPDENRQGLILAVNTARWALEEAIENDGTPCSCKNMNCQRKHYETNS
jgi:hypothetical protein